MLDRLAPTISILSSFCVIAGIVIVLQQLEQSVEAMQSDRYNSLDSTVGQALLGEEWAETYYRVQIDAPDLTAIEKLRYGEFLQMILNVEHSNGRNYSYFQENPHQLVGSACRNHNNSVGIEYLEHHVKWREQIGYGKTSQSLFLDTIKKGGCEGLKTWSMHIAAED